MNEVKQLLERARLRIQKPIHWTQGYAAKDERGESCPPSDPEARRWCALGALSWAGSALTRHHQYRAETLLGDAAETMLGPTHDFDEKEEHLAAIVNDEFEHKEVLEMFDRAIRTVSK